MLHTCPTIHILGRVSFTETVFVSAYVPLQCHFGAHYVCLVIVGCMPDLWCWKAFAVHMLCSILTWASSSTESRCWTFVAERPLQSTSSEQLYRGLFVEFFIFTSCVVSCSVASWGVLFIVAKAVLLARARTRAAGSECTGPRRAALRTLRAEAPDWSLFPCFLAWRQGCFRAGEHIVCGPHGLVWHRRQQQKYRGRVDQGHSFGPCCWWRHSREPYSDPPRDESCG